MRGFFLSLGVNAAFSLRWTVPAWGLLLLHFWRGWSIFWFVGALGLWLLAVFLKTLLLRALSRGGSAPERHMENKNPYSAETEKTFQQKKL